jgi:hypothetical protein
MSRPGELNLSSRTDHVEVTTMKRLDLGHLRPKLEVQRLSRLGRELSPGLIGGRRALQKRAIQTACKKYPVHLHMSAQPVENARDKTFLFFVCQQFTEIGLSAIPYSYDTRFRRKFLVN